jgi:hypothetical protein
MISKTKAEILEIKEKFEQVFNKVVTNPNFVPMAAGIAISTAASIAISLSSGDHSQSVFAVKQAATACHQGHGLGSSHVVSICPTKAIFW